MPDYKNMDTIVADCTKQNPPHGPSSYGERIATEAIGWGTLGAMIGAISPSPPVGAAIGGAIGAIGGGVHGAVRSPAAEKASKQAEAQDRVDTCVARALRDTAKSPTF